MPPALAPRCVVVTRVCFVTRLTPSTTTRLRSGSAAMTLPLTPRSLPAMTTTSSPFLTFMSLSPHSTSGASEMIFMNRLSRSSRPTGPKMRVPRGSPSARMSTAAFSSKRM